MFVGESRRALVERLLDDLAAVASDTGPRVVVLSSPPGWGKTRVVQEFYRRLAAEQPEPAYWPASLVDSDGLVARSEEMGELLAARKRVFPTDITVPAGAVMPWMWWGIRCSRMGDGLYVRAIEEAAPQLWAHAHGLDRGLDAGSAFDIGSAVIGVLGYLGCGMPSAFAAAFTVGGAAKAGWENRHLMSKVDEWRTRRSHDRQLSTARGSRRDLDDMAEGLTKLSRAQPLIMVIDDAHDADEELLGLLEQLMVQRARVLVIATAWPAHLAEESDRPFSKWWRRVLEAQPRLGRRDALEALDSNDILSVATADCPEIAGQAIELAEWFGENLLAVRGALRLESVRRELRETGRADLGRYLRDPDATFAAYWDELPSAVQRVLAMASIGGPRYVPEVIVAAAGGLHSARQAVDDGAHVYEWTRVLDETLHSFLEPMLFSVAGHRGRERLLTAKDVAKVHEAIRSTVTDSEIMERLSEEARFTVRLQHVHLAAVGLVPSGQTAAEDAAFVAEQLATWHEYSSAIDFANMAAGWATHPSERILVTRFQRAVWLGELGQKTLAISELRTLYEDLRRISEPDDARLVRIRRLLADLTAESGNIEEAIRELEELLADQLAGSPPDDREVVETRLSIAFRTSELERLKDAADQLEGLIPELHRLYGTHGRSALAARHELAMVALKSGRHAQAADVLDRLLLDLEEALGPLDTLTLSTRSALATCNGKCGNPQRAAEMFTQLLTDYGLVLGPDHPATLRTRGNIAYWIGEAGNTHEAIGQLEQLLTDRTQLLGPDHLDTLTTRNNLAVQLIEAGEHERAIRELHDVLAALSASTSAAHPSVLTARGNLAWALGEAGQSDEALRQLESVVSDCDRVLGPDHLDTLKVRHGLADQLGRNGRVGEAISQLRTLISDLLRTLEPTHTLRSSARASLVQLLAEAGSADEALDECEKLLDDQLRTFGEAASGTVALKILHAQMTGQAGNPEEAALLLRRVVDELASLHELDRHSGSQLRQLLLGHLIRANLIDEAILQLEWLVADHVQQLGSGHQTTMAATELLRTLRAR